MKEKIQILDCTLRDGGLGLEDAYKNGISDIRFNKDDYLKMIDCLRHSRLDIIELGSIEITPDDRTGFGIYKNVEQLSELMPEKLFSDQLFVGLYRGPDTPIEDIPKWHPGLVEGLRVIIRYSELQKSLDFCAVLSSKGYKVFVQPMLTMRYTEDELNLIIEEANKMGVYALYFVDSYGYMTPDDVSRLYNFYNGKLDGSIKIGFHAHNNMNMAYANVIHFMNIADNRPVIVDACATGMGQGAGNLQTEIIVPHLNRINADRYDYNSVLDTCDIVEKYNGQSLWGYSVTRLIPAMHKTAYKYAVALRKHYGLSLAEINRLLSNIPEELRHRYTPENTEQLLRSNGYLK